MRIIFFTIILIISLTLINTAKAEWISLNKDGGKKPVSLTGTNTNTPIKPTVDIIKDDFNSSEIKVHISGFDVNKQIINGVEYSSLDLLSNSSFAEKTGNPEIPCITKYIAIPDNAEISVEIINTSANQTFNGFIPLPARDSWFEGSAPTEYKQNSDLYSSSSEYPGELVKVVPAGKFRDFRIASVSIYPVHFDLKNSAVKALSELTFRINYKYSKDCSPKMLANKKTYITPAFDPIYRNMIINYDKILNDQTLNIQKSYDVMLCIVPDEFAASFQPLADWKQRSGIYVNVTKFSDIGANAQDPDIIKNYISKAYHEWEHPPTYVLLVGDYGICPIKYSPYPDYTLINENFFVTVDGEDFLPDLLIGRIPANSDGRLQVMVSKFIKYEQTPYIQNTEWFKKAVICSNDLYSSQIQTKLTTSQIMMQDGGFLSVDNLCSDMYDVVTREQQPCTVSKQDIEDSLTKGRSFLNYRGEAWTSGWYASCYSFETADIADVHNGEMMPFITNIGCGCAKFDIDGGNCFGEEWLSIGTPAKPRGACAFIGPTSNSKTVYNNAIDKGIYMGMFREGLETPGQALFRGKANMYNTFTEDPWVQYFYELYCVLGDPSIHIWKDVPRMVNVQKPVSFPLGFYQAAFVVTHTDDNKPVANAQVTLSGNNVFVTGFTDAQGKVSLPVNLDKVITLNLTVRGMSVYPFMDSVTTQTSTVYVYPSGDPVLVDVAGNNDGLGNPGEECTLKFLLKNSGQQQADNVSAKLISVDQLLATVLTLDPVVAGNIPVGTNGVEVPFNIKIDNNSKVGSNVPFTLQITSGNNIWEYTIFVKVEGCELVYKDASFQSEQEKVKPYKLDPGETSKLTITLQNTGTDIASNITGILSSTDPNVVITNANGTFNTIQAGKTGSNSGSTFEVKALPTCPKNYQAVFSLLLTTSDGNYPYSKTVDFKLDIGKQERSDPTGPDKYGYYVYTSVDDTIYANYPVYNWKEISGIGVNIDFTYYDNYKSIELPFDFKYYGVICNRIAISRNGWVALGNVDPNSANINNSLLPAADGIKGMIAACWDPSLQLDMSGQDSSGVYYYYDFTKNTLIIEWKNLTFYSLEHTIYNSFQIVLYDPAQYPTKTGDGEIIMNYQLIENSTGGTTGIENLDENDGIVYSYDFDYDPTASWLIHGSSIKFTTEKPIAFTPVIENPNISNQKPDDDYELMNYPNPFNGITTITYKSSNDGDNTIRINNLTGMTVRTFKCGWQTNGEYNLSWDGKDDNGNQVETGVYYYSLEHNGRFATMQKMVVIK